MSTFLLEELSCQPSGETQDMDRSAQAIGLASEYMLSLINDTLDMGRFEAGEVHLHRVPVNFRQLLDDTIVWARELVKDQDVGVEATVEANVPTSVVVDPVRSQQVVNNLIINAYKVGGRIFFSLGIHEVSPLTEWFSFRAAQFSPPQSKIKVHVSAKLTKSSGHTHTIHVAVTDMGPSLTPAQVQLLFQPYAIQTSACREYGGSGLGLAITNKISKLMGGWIECEPGNGGQGSVFTFVLPVAQVANASTHNKRDDSRGRDEAGELGVKQVAPPMLLDGQKCLERNVAAARFDELTKQLTERPLVARALEMSVGVGARLEHKKDTSLPSVDELSAGKNGSTVAMGPVDAQYQQVHMQPSSSASSANSNAGLGLVPVAPRPSSGFYGSDDGDMGFFQGGPTSPGARPRMPRRRTGDSMMSTAAAAAVATVGLQPGSRGSPRPSFDSFPDGLAREIRARLIEDDGSNDQVHQSGGGPQNYNTQSPSNVRHVRSIPRPALEVAPFTTVPRAPSPLQASLTQSPSVAPAALKQHAQNEKEVDARPVVIPATSSAEELHDRGNAILVVDDSGINRRILCRHLSRMTDLPIHQAADGQEAIKAYGAHNAPSYSIIFMDLMMPNVDGHEATRRIRDMGCTAPIVATTASVVPGEEVQAMVHLRESGMSQALPKPFTKEQIEGVLRTYQVQMIEAGQSPPKPPTFTRSAPVPVMAAGETTGLSPKGMPRHNNSSPEGLENIKPANDGMAPQPHRGRSQHQHQHLSSSPQGMPSYPSPTSRRPSLRDNALVQSSMQPLDNILQAPVPTPPQSQPQWLPPSLRLQSHPQPQPQPQKVSPHQLNHVRPRLPSPSDTLRQQATYMPAFSSQYYPPASVLSVPSAASLHRIRKSASADGSWNRGSFEPIKRPFVPQTQALEGEMHSTLYDIEDQSAAEAFKLSVPMLGRPALLPQASALLGCKSNSYVLSDAAEGNQPSPSDSPPAPRSRVILNSLPTRTIPPGRLIKTHSDPPSAIGTRPSTPLVLVVDDSNVSRGILGRVLDSIGLFETHDAINGIEALQRCFWSTYNIIFMDLEMPRMGGQEAAARIRSTGYAGPIIVITAHPLDSLPHGLAQVGITECLAKPITREVICAVLKRYHLLRGS
ncbi:hypothetical protein DFJ77DRAFT_449915 [Powellomyces hirtus]|nr:hypothetical protein DFJ77DRAFT_449915 [Powellomyces hirtus]